MRIDVITAFPKILRDPLDESILKQAKKRTQLQINIWDLREFATDKHRTLDDTPYGGGPGMIMKAEPIFKAFKTITSKIKNHDRSRILFPTPQGRILNQEIAAELSEFEHIIIMCGHYKSVDQRVIDTWVTDEISVGDYVLSGGEIPALLIIDAIVRLVPGAISDPASAKSDSFQEYLLDCPYYTRPENYKSQTVPKVLLSGNHKKIDEWRYEQKVQRTRSRRPDLYRKYLSKKSKKTENKN